MKKNKIILYTIVIILLSIITINFISTKIKSISITNITEEIITKVKKEIITELKQPTKKEINLKNSIKLKYKLVDNSKDRVYIVMYFRDLTSHHNLGIGYEYTDSKKDKRALLVEYTYKF